MEKNVRVRKVQVQLNKNKKRLRTWGTIFLLQLLILVLWHVGFFEAEWLKRALEAVQSFFQRVFWPMSEADFTDRTYRYYVYVVVSWIKVAVGYVVSWVKSLWLYPILELVFWFGPLALFCFFIVYRIVLRAVLWFAKRETPEKQPKPEKKPPQPKPVPQPKQPKEPRGPLVSGMIEAKAKEATRYLAELCSHHPALPTEDMGLWIGNQMPTDGGAVVPDRILRWKDGQIVYDTGVRGELVFRLEEEQAYLEEKGNLLALTVGEPMAVSYVNAAKEEVVVCTITWLGGF